MKSFEMAIQLLICVLNFILHLISESSGNDTRDTVEQCATLNSNNITLNDNNTCALVNFYEHKCLSKNFVFRRERCLLVQGFEKDTSIRCLNASINLTFRDSKQVYLNFFTIEACGALNIVNCSEVYIESVTMYNIGEVNFINYDRLTISNSSFHNTALQLNSNRNTSFQTNDIYSVYENPISSLESNQFFSGQQIVMPSRDIYYFMPGISVHLNIEIKNSKNNSVLDILQVKTSNYSFNVSVSKYHKILYESKRVTLIGSINASTILSISLLNRPSSEITLNVTLRECPPGYVWIPGNDNNELGKCYCSARTKNSFYLAIHYCNESNSSAVLKASYWAGYVDNNFRIGYCPKGFCINDTDLVSTQIYLPNTSSIGHDLSSYVCKSNRSGILCGSCKNNHSVFYHNRDYDCGPNDKCHIGWIYFLVSQILPLTFLFIVIIVFNISLTNGFINILVFYFQVFDVFHIDGNRRIQLDNKSHGLLNTIRFIVRTVQLDFFCLPKFSFCLWEGATTLQIISINYVTTVYALGLVILTVFVILPCLHKLKVNQVISVKSNISKTIIHGLTGFLVLCYFQSTKTSLLILNSTQLAGKKGILDEELRAYYNGNLKFFGRGHYYYATVALVFLVIISIIPPLLLLCYPLCYKALAVCKLQESRLSRILCKVLPLEKYKPLFDSFQSTYKDKHRYFAALFFIYRLVFLLTFAFVRGLSTLYSILQVEILIIMFIHAGVQPHKKKRHNFTDSFIFTLLAVLNGLTLLNYQNSSENHFIYQRVITLSALQVVISGIPIVMFLGYICYQVVLVQKPLLSKLCALCRSGMHKLMTPMVKRPSQRHLADLSLCESNSREADYNEFFNSSYSESV